MENSEAGSRNNKGGGLRSDIHTHKSCVLTLCNQIVVKARIEPRVTPFSVKRPCIACLTNTVPVATQVTFIIAMTVLNLTYNVGE